MGVLLCVVALIALVHSEVVLPSTWSWTSSNILVDVKPDTQHKTVHSIKDPTIILHEGTYHIYATVHTPSGYNMVYLNFTDFDDAHNAPWYYMDRTPGFSGYKCAPELFYFASQKMWYLVFQSPNPTYSTNKDPGNPAGWSTPKTFFNKMPNNGIDFFPICDNTTCYLFFSDDGGDWFRTSTPKSQFPDGWSGKFDTVLKSSDRFKYFEGSWVFKLTTQQQYIAGIEGIGSDGQRYYQAFTAPSLGGKFTPLADAFASNKNVKYQNHWNNGISHGELIHANFDETVQVNPCEIRFLYQGVDPKSTAPYEQLPYKLGLLTSTTQIQGC